MDLSYYANLAEILGTAAIVVSLVYVAVQIRQNTRATRLSTAQNISHELRDVTALVAMDAEMSEIHLRAIVNIESLTPTEKHRFYILTTALYRVFENAYFQNREGALDPYTWQGVVGQILIARDSSGYQTFWTDRKGLFSEDFQTYIENGLPKSELDLLTPYESSDDHE